MMGSDSTYLWTHHAREKMRYYRLTESRVKRIIRHPVRIEEGVLEGAVAAMQPAGGKRYAEIWTMYVLVPLYSRPDSSAPAADIAHSLTKASRQMREPSRLRPPWSRIQKNSPKISLEHAVEKRSGNKKKIKVITAWRYPGKSPARDPIPPEILREIKNLF